MIVIEVENTEMEFGSLSNDNEEYTAENDGDESDGDEISESELLNVFQKQYTLAAEKAVTLSKEYILHVSCTRETAPTICIGLSDNTCELYSLSNEQLHRREALESHTSNIVKVKFCDADNNLLYTGAADGCIKLWDLRNPRKSALEFTDSSATDSSQVKPLTCFDVSPNNRLLCAGTELCGGDAFLLFWDIRNTKLVGGYWESHTDDITNVTFHPSDANKLVSGSTDGLINVFDLQETNEDDALDASLNTDSTVEQVVWYGRDSLCCITHTADVQLWDTVDAVQRKTFSRADVTRGIQRKSAAHCYIANAHTTRTNGLFLLAGSNWHHGEVVRSLTVGADAQLTPNFALAGNKQRIRASWYNGETGTLITGGEQAILSVWQAPDNGELRGAAELKSVPPRQKKRSAKPY